MIYTLIGGIVNVVLFFLVTQEFQRYFDISLSPLAVFFLLLSFAFASPNFFLSLFGSIWFTSQIFATTYLLLFYLFYFRFLNQQKLVHFQLATVFFCLACLSRYSLIFQGLLFGYVFLHYKTTGQNLPRQVIWSFVCILLTFASLGLFYNYLKFQNILETGLRFQVGSGRYAQILKSNTILSFHYVLYNVYYYFLNIVHFSYSSKPVVIDREGNSVFSVYPALLLLPMLYYARKEREKKQWLFLIVSGVIISLSVVFLMLYFSTGWEQFGNRYFFDVIPLLFLLLIFVLPYVPIPVLLILLYYGFFVNCFGINQKW